MTLGNYPDLSFAGARIEAREKRTMLDKQRDPLLERRAAVERQRAAIVAHKARGTFRELAYAGETPEPHTLLIPGAMYGADGVM